MTMIFGVPIQALLGQLLVGLINGSFYALLSLGLAVIFGLLRVINFAHGAQYMLGAFVAFLGLQYFGINFWVALIVTPLVVALFGAIIAAGLIAILLAPLILCLSTLARRRGGEAGRAPTPWFVLGFVAIVLLNSALPLPPALHDALVLATSFLLTVALAAMGLETDIRKLQAKGVRPLALGALAWLFISGLGLGLVELI